MKLDTITSDRLILKPISKQHISEQYVSWLNDPDVYKYLESGGDYTLQKLTEYVNDVNLKNTLFWAIHLKSNNKHIGNIKIDPINSKSLVGEYGILIGDKSQWEKGIAKETSLLVLKYCFEILKLRKITLGVLSPNKAALNLYHSLGFEQEGLYKAHSLFEGNYTDIIRMAIFNPDIKKDESK